MDNMIIPGTNKEVRDGTIVILAGYGEVKYILHYGFYHYNSELCQGWYGESISEQIIIPIVEDMLVGCEIFYYPDADCCRFPNGDMPYTSQDDFQVQRSFITVSTEAERDALAPHKSITELPDGKIVCVLKPDGQTVDPKYYMYRHNPVDSECFWAELRLYVIPADGVPKSDLSEEVQNSLDKADTALQELPAYVIEWLTKNMGGQYDPASVVRNIAILNELANKSAKEYVSYISYRGVLYPAAFWISNPHKGVYATLYDVQVEQVVRLSISSEGTPATYVQDRVLSINTDEFDKYDSWIPATQESTAEYIDEVTDPKGAAQAVQDNLDVVAGTVSSLSADVTQLGSEVSEIDAVIPNQASAQNQLADKAFVNSSVATNTAHFIDTFDSVEALEEYSGPVTNNDYAFVVSYDPQQPTQIVAYDRYKWDSRDEEWKFEYELNNSSFTAEQWATINSGMTADLVTSTRNHIANTTIHVTSEDKAAWNDKYTKPPTGIPSSDMTTEVQGLLSKADTALQEIPIASDQTPGCVRVGENLTIDPQTGVMSAEASIETFTLYWYDEPTQEQKQYNLDVTAEIAQCINAGIGCQVQLVVGYGSTTTHTLPLVQFAQIPVVPPTYWIYRCGFLSGGTSTNFTTAYFIQSMTLPNGNTYYDQYKSDLQPVATSFRLGTVQIGSGINVDSNGVISVSPYELPPASADTLGGIKVGSGLSVDSETGVLSADSNVEVYIISTKNTDSQNIAIMQDIYNNQQQKNILVYAEERNGIRMPAQVRAYVSGSLHVTVDAYHIHAPFNVSGSYTEDNIYWYHFELNGSRFYKTEGWLGLDSLSDSMSSNSYQHAFPSAKSVVDYVQSKAYTLPAATADDLGGVKIGNGLSVDQDGVASVSPDTFVEVEDYTEDMSAVSDAIESASSTASAASIAASSAESAASAASSTASGALQAVQSHAADTTIHVTSAEKSGWNAKQNALSPNVDYVVPNTSTGISANTLPGHISRCTDTGWLPLTLDTSSGKVQAANSQQVPVYNGFAYRVVNGNHVYIIGSFHTKTAISSETIISTALPTELIPTQPVLSGSTISTQVCNIRYLCPTNATSSYAVVQLENGTRTLRCLSAPTNVDVSVRMEYFI